MLQTKDLFDLTHSLAAPLLADTAYPWEALSHIHDFILSLGPTLGPDYDHPAPHVWIAKTAVVAPTASITGPCIIGPDTEVRQCAFIRGSALVGAGCVVGNSTELKNVILFDHVQVPHYNYVGDSILGYKAHMGAGSITSNVKSDKTLVVVKDGQEQLDTGLKKLNPGPALGRDVSVYPLSSVRGTVPAEHIYKSLGNVVRRETA